LQQTCTARFLRRIRWNDRAAFAAEFACGGHFIPRASLLSNTARKFLQAYEHSAAPHLRQTRRTFTALACCIMKIIRQTRQMNSTLPPPLVGLAPESGVKPPHSKAASPRKLSCLFVSIRG